MYVAGCTEVEVKSTEEAFEVFWKGELKNDMFFFCSCPVIFHIIVRLPTQRQGFKHLKMFYSGLWNVFIKEIIQIFYQSNF